MNTDCAACFGMKMMVRLLIIKWSSMRCDLMIKYMLILILLAMLPQSVCAADEKLFELRREYNLVSAGIDSLVRTMQKIDDEVLKKPTVPEHRTERIIPNGMSLVMIFWADDEARIWLNDFVVGETRLTPVEVTVPDLYLKGQNQIRARCWDTDGVESGFICGLYLRDAAGVLYPVVVSNDQWASTDGGQAIAITYAHPSPDIPGAEPIWGTHVFGVLELTVSFDQAAVQNAVSKATQGRAPEQVQQRDMNYHDFVKQLSILQARRESLLKDMQAFSASVMSIPSFSGKSGRKVSLTLGKAGPLKEAMSEPISEKVRLWSQALPEEQAALIYPDKRMLKGEVAVNMSDGDFVPVGGDGGARKQDYTPPKELGPAKGKDQSSGQKGVSAESNLEGEGGLGSAGGGMFGRASRLGLLVPTLILGLYVLYVISHWKSITGRDARFLGEK